MRHTPLIKSGVVFWLFGLLTSMHALAQDKPTPQLVPDASNLLRVEGVDAGSGTHYVRLMLSLPAAVGSINAPPRFTMECTESKGKRELSWFLSFGGVEDTQFTPPFRPSDENPFPPPRPSVRLKMIFEGYTKWRPFVRVWEVLPSGALRYRNPGMQSPNMDTPRSFLQYLNPLPGLRIGYARPSAGDPHELFFETRPLLNEVQKTSICQP
jgi:hypothetical protein